MKPFVCLIVCVIAASAGRADAATRTVCASGCQYTNLQAAIDAAVGGDTLLLRAGETFTGNFVLRAKSTASSAFITIRSDAPDSELPPPGVRLIPEGRPGANTARNVLPRLVGQGGGWKSTPVLRTAPGAHHYRLQCLEIDGTGNLGYETLLAIGQNDSAQSTLSQSPFAIVIDRLYLHGHPAKGIKRGIALNSRSTDILDSYISDIMSVSDAQAIGGWNGAGPFRIINNYLEATGENVMFGGADPRIPNLVPSDIELRGNYLYKQPAWRNAILDTPGRPVASAGSGGSLGPGTHFFRVVAVMATGGAEVVSTPSPEVSTSVGGSGSVRLSWPRVSDADAYRVYRGASSSREAAYVETTGTSLTYTGAGERSGSLRPSGTRWTAKNLIELKNARRVTIDGNLLEHNWDGFQSGYAVVFTPVNQEQTAPWSTVEDVTFTNNTTRHVAAALNISGRDYEATSQVAHGFRIANNLFEDVSSAYGNTGRFMVMSGGPRDVVVEHNTILGTGTVVEIGGAAVTGFVFRNNMALHNHYGIKGDNHSTGIDTLNAYFPGWVFDGNVLAGGDPTDYPPGNLFPSVAAFDAAFVDPSGGDFTLLASSAFHDAATDGTDIGIDSAALRAAQGGDPVGAPTDPAPPDGGTGVLPEGWRSQDIGLVALPGTAGYADGTFRISGAGDDIWGTADAFHYAYRTLAGDGVIVARVASVEGSEAWTKVGVMIRASVAANAAQALMLVSTGKGLAFQRRTAAGLVSTHTPGPSGQAPRWVKLQREGTVITASTSTDGVTWTIVGRDTFEMPDSVLVGLAVGSHTTAELASGTFDHVAVTEGATLPEAWESADVGTVSLPGSDSESGGTFTVTGSGADVWGDHDAFHFVWQTLDGDGAITARVAAVSGAEAWTKVGVMMRMTLDAGAAHAFMLVSQGKGVAFQRRRFTGGTSTHTGIAGAAPMWVRLVRRGDVITGMVSRDGQTWTTVGTDTFGIAGSVDVGLAVTSHDASRSATGTFDNVTVTR